MTTNGLDAAVTQHHDAIGFEHGGQPMGDDQGGAIGHGRFKGRLHHTLACTAALVVFYTWNDYRKRLRVLGGLARLVQLFPAK